MQKQMEIIEEDFDWDEEEEAQFLDRQALWLLGEDANWLGPGKLQSIIRQQC